MRKYFISMLFLTLPLVSLAYDYDTVDVTPRSWQQVTLNYTDLINEQSYLAEIKLLRPIEWLKENDIDQVGKRSVFSLPEFGIDQVEVTVTEIAGTKVDTKAFDWRTGKTKTVIGTFKRYAQDVRTYTFIDDKGNTEQINATPNHPFYVVDKQAYIAIDDIEDGNELISQSGQKVGLVCLNMKQKSCGEQMNNQVPMLVYNIEVMKQHLYYVSKSGILVHNVCDGIVSEPIRVRTDISKTYRWDSRSPEVIARTGFQGTKSQWNNRIFGNKTVYSSIDQRGSAVYRKELVSGLSKNNFINKKKFYLYEIDTNDIAAVHLGDINTDPDDLARRIVSRLPVDKQADNLPVVSRYVYNTGRHNGEVQLFGPISPERITYTGKMFKI